MLQSAIKNSVSSLAFSCGSRGRVDDQRSLPYLHATISTSRGRREESRDSSRRLELVRQLHLALRELRHFSGGSLKNFRSQSTPQGMSLEAPAIPTPLKLDARILQWLSIRIPRPQPLHAHPRDRKTACLQATYPRLPNSIVVPFQVPPCHNRVHTPPPCTKRSHRRVARIP